MKNLLMKFVLFVTIPSLAYTFTQVIQPNGEGDGDGNGQVAGNIDDLLPRAIGGDGYGDYDWKIPKVCAQHAGCMLGKLMPGYRSESFEAFLGIPYALPPVGDLRFSHPKAYPRWFGVLNATEPKSDCAQKNVLIPNPIASGSEDCLYLNVYRPLSRRNFPQKLPVLVYIHGGGWFTGSAHPAIVGPEYFMDTKEVILVTFTYRLGVFGFLSTQDAIAPGNFGLKDQTLALKWVQKNIASFGGNPKQVTIFGQSAGGISAHMHMLSKHSLGLFQGVIALSGPANVPFAIQPNGLELARLTAVHSHIPNATELSTAKLLKALRSVDVDTLLTAADAMKYWDVDPLTLYRPVVESYDSNEAFFTEHPSDIFARGDYKAVPFMMGVVPDEGAVRAIAILESQQLRNDFDANFDYLLEAFLDLPMKFNRSRLDATMSSIIDEYFEGKHVLSERGFVDVVTDRGFHHPFYNAIKTHISTTNTDLAPLYLYYFNYTGPFTYSNVYSGGVANGDYGVVHCDDLIYLFRSPILFPDFAKNSTHAKVSDAFVSHFVQFAKTRKPYPTKECTTSNFPLNSEDSICDYVSFENGPGNSFVVKTENKFNVRRMHFWDELLKED